MPIDPTRITAGMSVVSSEGNEAGIVKEVRANHFLLDRPVARDVYLPYTTIQDAAGETVTLNISGGQIDDLGWADDPAATVIIKHPEGQPVVTQADLPLTRPPV
jgi:hypothetical protein